LRRSPPNGGHDPTANPKFQAREINDFPNGRHAENLSIAEQNLAMSQRAGPFVRKAQALTVALRRQPAGLLCEAARACGNLRAVPA
jgi:hypothetical protein